MIALTACLAFLSVALAAPQLDLRPQIISSQPQVLGGQAIRTQYVDSQPQVFSGQTLRTQYVDSQPQVLNAQPFQTQYISSQPQVLSAQPINYQTLPVSNLNYQQVPIQTLRVSQPAVSSQSLTTSFGAQPVVRTGLVSAQPAFRTVTAKPAVRAQAIVQTPRPYVQSTIAPLTVQQQIVPQVQVQQRLAVPQIQLQQRLVPQLQVQQRVLPQQQNIAILRQVQDVQADGTYAFAFETENGIRFQEEGRTVNQGTQDESSVVQGSYSYQAPDGTPITVNYIADANGYRAEGEHIPKAPEAIVRANEYLRSLPPRPEDSEGQYVRDSNGY